MTEFDVFDVHHHVGRAFDALGGELVAEGDDAAAFARVELADRLRIMDEGGVRQALVIPGHGYLRPDGIADTRRVNDEIAAYRDRTADRFPVACGIVEPTHGAASLAEIARVHDELGLVALSFHTRFQGVSLDSQWILRYLERMGELGLVPILHAMDDTPEEALWKLTLHLGGWGTDLAPERQVTGGGTIARLFSTFHGWAVGGKKTVVETQDGGKTWQKLSVVKPESGENINYSAYNWIAFATPKVGLITGWNVPPRRNGTRRSTAARW